MKSLKDMTIPELAERIAIKKNFPKAEKYNMVYREFDNMIEVIGYLEDPGYDLSDLGPNVNWTPKSWLTIGVIPASMEIRKCK